MTVYAYCIPEGATLMDIPMKGLLKIDPDNYHIPQAWYSRKLTAREERDHRMKIAHIEYILSEGKTVMVIPDKFPEGYLTIARQREIQSSPTEYLPKILTEDEAAEWLAKVLVP